MRRSWDRSRGANIGGHRRSQRGSIAVFFIGLRGFEWREGWSPWWLAVGVSVGALTGRRAIAVFLRDGGPGGRQKAGRRYILVGF